MREGQGRGLQGKGHRFFLWNREKKVRKLGQEERPRRHYHRCYYHIVSFWRFFLNRDFLIFLGQTSQNTASFSQQTEDRACCPVVQLFWLRASHCTDYHVTSLLFLRVTCPCSLRTYATLKLIRSSSSSSSASWTSRRCRMREMFD